MSIYQFEISDLAEKLEKGSLALFPTDTLPAIAACPEFAPQLWDLKKRPVNNHLICHLANITEVERNVILNDKDYELANTFWPGPLTLILEKKKNSQISSLVSNNLNLIGCRIPSNKITLNLSFD